jgi:branched-chain amino acid transport system substrate-binding protein
MVGKLKKTHPEIVNLGSVWPSFTNQEFSNIISAALAKKPDVIIVGQAGPGWAALCQQGIKFNLFKKTRAVGCYMLESAVTASFGKNYPEGMETVGWCPFWEQTKPMQDYLKEHLALTKVYPADKGIELHLAALGLVAAMKKAGSADPEAITSALENLAFDGPIGPVHFDDYDHQLKIPIWYETTGYSKDFPIAVATHMIKYGDEVYPTKEEILALRAKK